VQEEFLAAQRHEAFARLIQNSPHSFDVSKQLPDDQEERRNDCPL
jgi:hypothetical protein